MRPQDHRQNAQLPPLVKTTDQWQSRPWPICWLAGVMSIRHMLLPTAHGEGLVHLGRFHDNNNTWYTVDLVIFVCLNSRDFLNLRIFKKLRIRKFSFLFRSAIIIITILDSWFCEFVLLAKFSKIKTSRILQDLHYDKTDALRGSATLPLTKATILLFCSNLKTYCCLLKQGSISIDTIVYNMPISTLSIDAKVGDTIIVTNLYKIRGIVHFFWKWHNVVNITDNKMDYCQ